MDSEPKRQARLNVGLRDERAQLRPLSVIKKTAPYDAQLEQEAKNEPPPKEVSNLQ